MSRKSTYTYDVFVSYSPTDEDWVQAELLPRLAKAGIRYIEQSQFEPGHPRLDEIERAVKQSLRTLLILTPDYLNSTWQQFDSILAGSYGLDTDRWPVIPAIKADCQLPPRLRALVSLDLRQNDASSWQRLIKTCTTPAHFFICYKRNVETDHHLAAHLFEFLTAYGHEVFIDRKLLTGEDWLKEIDRQIKASDFLIVLLSEGSANSEMVQAEVRRAYEYRKSQKRPNTLPVRMAYEGLLPYSIDAFLDPLQYVIWQSEADNDRVGYDILAAIGGRLPARAPVQTRPMEAGLTISEDGRIIAEGERLHPPLPEFDPRFIEELPAPGGAVGPRDQFYIERAADAHLQREVVKSGTTTTIRASRQTGKSSLLVRGIHHARQSEAKIVHLDLQRIDNDHLQTPDAFLRYLAEFIIRRLRLDPAEVENFWSGSLGPQDKLTYLLEDYVLPETNAPIILAMDEVDRLLLTTFYGDFFALVRSWHNSRALDEGWRKLNLVMVISTEPYLLIPDASQSPFNIGLKLYLEDFNQEQVEDLNRRHGSPVETADFPQLMELLSGHPYLTRKALYTLVTERLTWAELTRVAATEQGPFGDHLRHHHWLLRQEPELQKALKNVIRGRSHAAELALSRLSRAGLIKGRGDVYTCRCDLYRRYFEGRL